MLWEGQRRFGQTTARTVTVTTAPAVPKSGITASRNMNPLVAGQAFTTSWSTSNATSLSRLCTAAGSGYNANESLALNGLRTQKRYDPMTVGILLDVPWPPMLECVNKI